MSIAILSTSRQAQAFSISDHGAITRLAVAELTYCGAISSDPDVSPRGFFETLAQSNLFEDLNLGRKWSHYSHYYHPLKKLDMRRADSSVTIEESEQSLRADPRMPLEQRAELLGRIVHHIQDAAAPIHVVPVSHWLTDGFESLKAHPAGAGFKIPDCKRLEQLESLSRTFGSLLDVLRWTALGTLTTLDESISYRRASVWKTTSWREAFWRDSEGTVFGDYGFLGNSFGKTVFMNDDGEVVEFEPDVYRRYKEGRMRAAVEATQAAWLWYRTQRLAISNY